MLLSVVFISDLFQYRFNYILHVTYYINLVVSIFAYIRPTRIFLHTTKVFAVSHNSPTFKNLNNPFKHKHYTQIKINIYFLIHLKTLQGGTTIFILSLCMAIPVWNIYFVGNLKSGLLLRIQELRLHVY